MKGNGKDVNFWTSWGFPITNNDLSLWGDLQYQSTTDMQLKKPLPPKEESASEWYFPAQLTVNGQVWDRTVSAGNRTISYHPQGHNFLAYHITTGPNPGILSLHETRSRQHSNDVTYQVKKTDQQIHLIQGSPTLDEQDFVQAIFQYQKDRYKRLLDINKNYTEDHSAVIEEMNTGKEITFKDKLGGVIYPGRFDVELIKFLRESVRNTFKKNLSFFEKNVNILIELLGKAVGNKLEESTVEELKGKIEESKALEIQIKPRDFEYLKDEQKKYQEIQEKLKAVMYELNIELQLKQQKNWNAISEKEQEGLKGKIEESRAQYNAIPKASKDRVGKKLNILLIRKKMIEDNDPILTKSEEEISKYIEHYQNLSTLKNKIIKRRKSYEEILAEDIDGKILLSNKMEDFGEAYAMLRNEHEALKLAVYESSHYKKLEKELGAEYEILLEIHAKLLQELKSAPKRKLLIDLHNNIKLHYKSQEDEPFSQEKLEELKRKTSLLLKTYKEETDISSRIDGFDYAQLLEDMNDIIERQKWINTHVADWLDSGTNQKTQQDLKNHTDLTKKKRKADREEKESDLQKRQKLNTESSKMQSSGQFNPSSAFLTSENLSGQAFLVAGTYGDAQRNMPADERSRNQQSPLPFTPMHREFKVQQHIPDPIQIGSNPRSITKISNQAMDEKYVERFIEKMKELYPTAIVIAVRDESGSFLRTEITHDSTLTDHEIEEVMKVTKATVDAPRGSN